MNERHLPETSGFDILSRGVAFKTAPARGTEPPSSPPSSADGDGFIEALVDGAVDDPEAAVADDGGDLVFPLDGGAAEQEGIVVLDFGHMGAALPRERAWGKPRGGDGCWLCFGGRDRGGPALPLVVEVDFAGVCDATRFRPQVSTDFRGPPQRPRLGNSGATISRRSIKKPLKGFA